MWPHAQQGQPTASCWACGTLVHVPVVDGSASTAWQCGWCGCLCDSKACRSPKRRSKWGRWVIPVCTAALMVSIIGLGMAILPRAVPSTPRLVVHYVWCLLLAACVILHHAVTIATSPGRVRECIAMPPPACTLPAHGGGGGAPAYPQGCFWQFVRCQACNDAKPPGVHHCSTCNACFVDMDHHCVFLGVCIARGNLRSFLAFLAWVLIATSYCAYMAARLLWAHRASIPFIPSPHLHAISIPARLAARVSTAAIYLLSSAPWWLAAAYYIFSASSALLLAMGALLVSQLRYLSLGITYVEFLQHGQREAARLQQLRPPPQQAGPPGQARGAQDQQQGQADPQAALPAAAAGQQPPRASARRLLARLAEIFGSANPATWLLPRWQPPAGTFVHACKKLA